MKTVFVDESGNLGKKDRYFVIALLNPQRSKRLANIIKRHCAENKLEEVKASRLTFSKKQDLLNKLTSLNDYIISYIVADKKHIQPRLLADPNLTYNYLLSFLVRKTIKTAREDLNIILDNHSTKVGAVNSLADYIKLKAYTEWGFTNNLSITYMDYRDCRAIQAVDLMANAVYAKYNYGVCHFYSMLTIGESVRFPQEKFST